MAGKNVRAQSSRGFAKMGIFSVYDHAEGVPAAAITERLHSPALSSATSARQR